MDPILREKCIPNVLKWFIFQVRPWSEKGKVLRHFLAPIQIASDLEKLILWPEKSENLIKVAKRLSKEPWEPSKKTSWIIY